MTLAFTITVLCLLVVAIPLYWGSNLPLQPGSTQDSPEILEDLREQILARYLDEEKQHQQGDVSRREWTSRQEFLKRRYVDLSKRLDYVRRKSST